MTSLALSNNSAVWSTFVSVCVPTISFFDFPAPKSAYEPKMTLSIDLFIALHMIYVRIAPEEPMTEPQIVNNELFNMKPSAHKAQPD